MTLQDTYDHIEKVRAGMRQVIGNLTERASAHDSSKTVEPELSGYEVMHADLAPVAFGTPEYWQAFERHRPTVAHHFANNTHHPEHYKNGVGGMCLLDVIEMLADWKAASERPTSKTSFADGLEHNRERFGISDQLYGIMRNTAMRLGWISIRVYQVNEADTVAAASLAEAIKFHIETVDLPREDCIEDVFLHEYTAEEMEANTIVDEVYVDGPDGTATRTFREQLDVMIAAGVEFPAVFGSSEY